LDIAERSEISFSTISKAARTLSQTGLLSPLSEVAAN
jgi:aminopeptidase-like protein